MPRGKRQLNRPSAGGIVRNDYHRRNRKENKSMHKHSFGRQIGLERDWMPRLQLDALIREAVAQSSRRSGLHPHLVGVKKACVDYLRHCHTDYEQQLKATRGRRYSPIADFIAISELVFKDIAETYPWLADECDQQLEHRRRIAARTRCVRKAEFQSRCVELFNQQQAESIRSAAPTVAVPVDDDYDEGGFLEFDAALTSLASSRLLYQPPFLKPAEIRERRFSGKLTMNDRWWEWEEDKQLKVPEREQRFRWAT